MVRRYIMQCPCEDTHPWTTTKALSKASPRSPAPAAGRAPVTVFVLETFIISLQGFSGLNWSSRNYQSFVFASIEFTHGVNSSVVLDCYIPEGFTTTSVTPNVIGCKNHLVTSLLPSPFLPSFPSACREYLLWGIIVTHEWVVPFRQKQGDCINNTFWMIHCHWYSFFIQALCGNFEQDFWPDGSIWCWIVQHAATVFRYVLVMKAQGKAEYFRFAGYISLTCKLHFVAVFKRFSFFSSDKVLKVLLFSKYLLMTYYVPSTS